MKTNQELGLAKRRALRIIRRIQPNTARSLPGLILREIKKGKKGNGAFRRAYEIVGTGLVIKFPRQDYADNAEHTRDEVKKIRALSKYRSLKKHLPPVYYYNRRDGVMVTDYYPLVSPAKNLGPMFTDLLYEFTGVVVGDLFGDNVRCKKPGQPVIVDLGY